MAERLIRCLCGETLLARWTDSGAPANYSLVCPRCYGRHQVCASPPVQIFQRDSTGCWQLIHTLGSPGGPRAKSAAD